MGENDNGIRTKSNNKKCCEKYNMGRNIFIALYWPLWKRKKSCVYVCPMWLNRKILLCVNGMCIPNMDVNLYAFTVHIKSSTHSIIALLLCCISLFRMNRNRNWNRSRGRRRRFIHLTWYAFSYSVNEFQFVHRIHNRIVWTLNRLKEVFIFSAEHIQYAGVSV